MESILERWQKYANMSFYPNPPPKTLSEFLKTQTDLWEQEFDAHLEPDFMRPSWQFSKNLEYLARSKLICYPTRAKLELNIQELTKEKVALDLETDVVKRRAQKHASETMEFLERAINAINRPISDQDPRYTATERYHLNDVARKELLLSDILLKMAELIKVLKVEIDSKTKEEVKKDRLGALRGFNNYLKENEMIRVRFGQVMSSDNFELWKKAETDYTELEKATLDLNARQAKITRLELERSSIAEAIRCSNLASHLLPEALRYLEGRFRAHMRSKHGNLL